jgi:hypothetical protein
MSELLTDEERPLHRAQSGEHLSFVAQARTLTVLGRMGGSRKGSVLQFLYESGRTYEEATLLGESTLFHEGVFKFPLRGAYRPLRGLSGVVALESDHARLLRGFAPAGERRRYPKASSMPSAACLPIEGIQ